MTKSILSLLTVLCSFVGVHAQTEDIVRVEFTSVARGKPFEKISVTKDSIRLLIGEKESVRTIKDSEWKEIRQAVKFPLQQIPDLKSPTMKRTYDAASHSTIIITDENGRTWNHGFDDIEPHDKLQPLMNCLERIRRSVL